MTQKPCINTYVLEKTGYLCLYIRPNSVLKKYGVGKKAHSNEI